MFENLQVYQKAVDFADNVAALTEKFPPWLLFLVDQLNRAALSITTNLAEEMADSPSLIASTFSRLPEDQFKSVFPCLRLPSDEVS